MGAQVLPDTFPPSREDIPPPAVGGLLPLWVPAQGCSADHLGADRPDQEADGRLQQAPAAGHHGQR